MVKPQSAVGAAAVALLVSRANDACHIRRLVFTDSGAVEPTLKMWFAALTIYAYERAVAKFLLRLNLPKVPSTLAAMLSLFGGLHVLQNCPALGGRRTADQLALLLKPGVDFLGKWMGAFLAPPLVSLDASIKALPPYSSTVWARVVALLASGWGCTHAASGFVASRTAPAIADHNSTKVVLPSSSPAAVQKQADNRVAPAVMSQDEAVRRAWVFIGALSYLAVSFFPVLPQALHRPVGMLCQLSTTIGSLALAKVLPDATQRLLHPIVICAASSNLCSRFVGPVAPYFDDGRGVGDMLFRWLPAAVTGLGVRMYSTTDLWLDNPEDFRCVLATCGVSGCFSVGVTALLAVSTASPLAVPSPLALPLLNRSVMSALGIEGAKAIGPECDPKLAVASILITGCIGASLGNSLLFAFPAVFNSSSPLVRGLAMGCSAHSIGTAGLISYGDEKAAAVAGVAMCLAGTMHTIVLNLPGFVPWIRVLAALPPPA